MMFSSTTSFLCSLLLLVVSSPTLVVGQSQICSLCETSTTIPKRFDYRDDTFPAGQTCLNVYVDMSTFSGTECTDAQALYRDPCCADVWPPTGGGTPTGPNAAPAAAPASAPTTPTGPYSPCQVCGKNGPSDEYPGKPDVYIHARYVGSFSCDQLYHRGKNGDIDDFMCMPLQGYTYEECGCGIHNPNYGNPQPTPTALPPAASPVASIASSPTQAPVAAPTRVPTSSNWWMWRERNLRGSSSAVVEELKENVHDGEAITFEFTTTLKNEEPQKDIVDPEMVELVEVTSPTDVVNTEVEADAVQQE